MGKLLVLGFAVIAAFASAQSAIPDMRPIVGLKVLHDAVRFHRVLSEYDAEFTLRTYNPALSHFHHDEFAMWLNKEYEIFSLLAIRTELYGQSYTASPAFAQWWEGSEARSTEQPMDLFSIDAPWFGPFGDTVVGSIMLNPAYRLSELWRDERIQSLSVSEGVFQFRTRGSDGQPILNEFPYWQIQIQTQHYTVTLRVGKHAPLLLYAKTEKGDRLLWEETWYPLRWR